MYYSLNIKITAYGISALGCIGVLITSVVAVKWKEIFLRLNNKKNTLWLQIFKNKIAECFSDSSTSGLFILEIFLLKYHKF